MDIVPISVSSIGAYIRANEPGRKIIGKTNTKMDVSSNSPASSRLISIKEMASPIHCLLQRTFAISSEIAPIKVGIRYALMNNMGVHSGGHVREVPQRLIGVQTVSTLTLV